MTDVRRNLRSADGQWVAADGGTFGLALLLGTVILAWGSNYVVMKLAVGLNGPWTFNALRYGTAVVILGVALGFQSGWRKLVPAPGERAATALVGLLQAAVMTGCTTWALTRIDANRTVLIVYSMPIWAVLFEFLSSRDRPTLHFGLSIALGFGGLATLCAPWSMEWSSAGALTGSAAALIGSVAWALGAVYYRSRVWESPLASQVFVQVLTAASASWVCYLLFESQPLELSFPYAAIVLYNALIPTVLAFWVWAKILERLPAPVAGQFVLLSPIAGILASAAVLGEAVTAPLIVSTAMILGGALMAYMQPRAETRSNGR